MKFLVAIVALLALCGSAMAWTLSDDLQYTYIKAGTQEAGSNLILAADEGATSNAHFFDPAVTNGLTGNFPIGSSDGQTFLATSQATTIIPASAATVSNTLGAVTVDRVINYPGMDLRNADFATMLTQGGDASVALHSINDNSIDPITKKATTPEMVGTADAYQNLYLAGGFDTASTNFQSAATVGVDNLFAITATGTSTTANSASVNSQTHGGGLIDSADLGEQVTSDVSRDFTNSAWQTPEYSGGIKMWADFTASDPTCANPIISSVSGSSWTSLFPGAYGTNGNWGGDAYWGGSSGSSITTLSPFKV